MCLYLRAEANQSGNLLKKNTMVWRMVTLFPERGQTRKPVLFFDTQFWKANDRKGEFAGERLTFFILTPMDPPSNWCTTTNPSPSHTTRQNDLAVVADLWLWNLLIGCRRIVDSIGFCKWVQIVARWIENPTFAQKQKHHHINQEHNLSRGSDLFPHSNYLFQRYQHNVRYLQNVSCW